MASLVGDVKPSLSVYIMIFSSHNTIISSIPDKWREEKCLDGLYPL